jgi:hypothetical protein
MQTRWSLSAGLAFAWIGLWTAPSLATGLLTIQQATELSEKTGRPIFAVAGSAK